MINLEELNLCLQIARSNTTFIDGNQLYNQFLISMTKLKKFTFNINTFVHYRNVNVELQSNEEIQRSFTGRFYQEVFSHVKINPSERVGECHIYSLPYNFEYYFNVDNSFSGGRFEKVRQLRMYDPFGFTFELFHRISQDFPCLEYLNITNGRAMRVKPDLCTSVITFPYLKFLNLREAHDDYGVFFLLKQYVHLPQLACLRVRQASLEKITKNFTSDPMTLNLSKVKDLNVGLWFAPLATFHMYFSA
ncbi:unnamed protein product [Adineta ricciae]|uniref:Uncharacterized protein n=1 Tax=Adineta ricciae TaxID=249248 RepID=A0A815KLN2_ADIRI|nr:unnamed protein product [Adineta ricciae]CAF1395115.1 unnamed protein product [Adineta ricciae]